jgi:hypothetical protein
MTPQAALLVDPAPGWAVTLLASLVPGAHAVILTDEVASIEGRRAGLELRDTLLILSTGPCSRFGFLFRVPSVASTLAGQAEETKTGFLNIQRCRVAADMSEFFSTTGKPRSGLGHARAYGMGDGYGGDLANPPNSAGRWPSNLLFVHGDHCRSVGTQRVPGTSRHGTSTAIRRSGVHAAAGGHQSIGREQPVTGYAAEDGRETVAAWECEPSCPVRILDYRTGERPSTLTGRADPMTPHRNPGNNGGHSLFGAGNSFVYADGGGASRFYPQFSNNDEMLGWLRMLIETPDDSCVVKASGKVYLGDMEAELCVNCGERPALPGKAKVALCSQCKELATGNERGVKVTPKGKKRSRPSSS